MSYKLDSGIALIGIDIGKNKPDYRLRWLLRARRAVTQLPRRR
jgi:hypothetical protein